LVLLQGSVFAKIRQNNFQISASVTLSFNLLTSKLLC